MFIELVLPAAAEHSVLIGALEGAWVVGSSAWLLNERRPPTSTLAWILALAFLPVVGVAVYLVLGPRRFDRKKFRLGRLRRERPLYLHAFQRRPPAERTGEAQLQRLAVALDAPPPETASRVDVLGEGDLFYAAVEEAIAAARHHVHAEFYIFAPDATGRRIRDALAAAAGRGVSVRLLVDDAGSWSLGDDFLGPLLSAGGEVARFNPVLFGRLRGNSANFRTHRKIVVCDGSVGFTGGINVEDRHSATAVGARAWRDTAVRIEGAAVHGLQLTFLENWSFAQGSTTLASDLGALAPYFPACERGPHAVQVVPSGPDQQMPAISLLYPAVISAARERVWLTTPYFIPDEAMTAALTAAALRGVDVRLLLPRRTDQRVIDAASRTWHDALARVGVRIAFYRPTMLHAKTCVVDRDLGVVGTANLDNRSLRLNFEVVAVLYDAASVEALARLFEADLAHAKPRSGREADAPFLSRLAASAARLLAPQL